MKKIKCSECKNPIPKGTEAYMKGKIICQYCDKKAKKHTSKKGLSNYYLNWLEISNKNDK